MIALNRCVDIVSTASVDAKDWSSRIFEALGHQLLRADWDVNKTYDANASDRRSPGMAFLAPAGHPPTALILPTLVALFVVAGPALASTSWLALALGVVALLAMLAAARMTRNDRALLWVQIALLGVLAGAVWLLAGSDGRAWQGRLYQHNFVPLALAFLIVIVLSKLLAIALFRPLRTKLAAEVREIDLFPPHRHVGTGRKGLLLNALTAPLRDPLLLLYPPAVAVILTPAAILSSPAVAFILPSEMYVWIAALAAAWLFIALADTYETFDHMRAMVRRMLFVGGQLVVSVAVVALAAAQLAGVHYVTTLLESDPGLATIFLYVAASYAIFWFYGYWTGRILSEHVLDAFREPGDKGQGARICSPYQARSCATAAPDQKRVLQIHGAARFAVVKPEAHAEQLEAGWPRYDIDDFIDQIGNAAKPAQVGLRHRLALIKQMMRFHRIVSNVALAALLVLPGWYFSQLPQRAELSVAGAGEGLFDLPKRLAAAGDRGGDHAGASTDDRPHQAILLAASGGGTRAALFTQSVLRGLADLGVLDQLVLASGVSGGSLALAYFAAHHEELLDPANACAWERFSAAMAQPFIQDALRDVSEWRVVASHAQNGVQMGLRTGDLLAESFERRLRDESALDLPDGCNGSDGLPAVALRDAPLGLIFNTSVVGCFPYWECRGVKAPDLPAELEHCQDAARPLAARERDCEVLRTSELAGSRLILTNLADKSPFVLGDLVAQPDEYLNYQVVQDPAVSLARAAALSANFPPVFSNAAVDIGGRVRYWVTDGGATDNRGIISLLYALDGALERLKHVPHNEWPVMHVIVAEASATDLSFRQDRGLGAKFGAPEKFASQLMLTLKRTIEHRFPEGLRDKFRFHYVSMPAVLRSNGGFGTHWMLPGTMHFHAPLSEQFAGLALKQAAVTLPGAAVRQIIDALHLPPESKLWPAAVLNPEDQPVVEVLQQWIEADDYRNHRMVWGCTVDALTGGQVKRGGFCAGKTLVGMAQ